MRFKHIAPAGIAIHSAATLATMDIDIDWIRHEHLKRGFADVGYHYFIKRDGTVQKGRPDDQQGAHIQYHNHYILGICMAGGLGSDGLGENNFTEPQWGALAKLVATLLRDNHELEFVVGHRDIPGTSTECPSFDVPSWVESHTLLMNQLERNQDEQN